ncbi:MAG: hypothetical protein ACLR1T_12030 [Evtepia gabavorous]
MDWAASRYFLVEHPDPAIPGRLLFPQLSPGADATRGETAVFLSRFCQAYLDQAETGLTPVTVQAYGPGYGENIAVSSPGLPPEESQRVFSLAVTIAQMGEPWDRVSFHPSAGHALPQPGSLTEAEQAMTAHYDDHGRLIQVTRVIDGVPRQQYAFQYDSLGRVCYAEDNTEAPGVQYFMTYDQHGNLAYLSVANESLHPAAYAFYYTQAEGAWVLTGVGSAQEDLILFEETAAKPRPEPTWVRGAVPLSLAFQQELDPVVHRQAGQAGFQVHTDHLAPAQPAQEGRVLSPAAHVVGQTAKGLHGQNPVTAGMDVGGALGPDEPSVSHPQGLADPVRRLPLKGGKGGRL